MTGKHACILIIQNDVLRAEKGSRLAVIALRMVKVTGGKLTTKT